MKKFSKTLMFAAVLGLAFGSVAPAYAKEGTWIEFFFPSLKQKGVDPAETLKAPFAMDPNEKAVPLKPGEAKPVLPEDLTPIDQPHRDNAEISGWLTTAVANALTFNTPNYQDAMNASAKYFTADGRAQYVQFLTDNNIMKVLDSKKFQLSAFVQDAPLLLNEGAVDGVYRWLYEVPMMVSYLDYGVKDYKTAQPVNQQITVTVQIGRTKDNPNGQSILIERWDGKIERTPAK